MVVLHNKSRDVYDYNTITIAIIVRASDHDGCIYENSKYYKFKLGINLKVKNQVRMPNSDFAFVFSIYLNTHG